MEKFNFDRIVRTSYSEVYYIYDEDIRIGELHMHILKNSASRFTLILDKDVSSVDENSLLEQIDLELANDFDVPYFGYYINVFRGVLEDEYEVVNDVNDN